MRLIRLYSETPLTGLGGVELGGACAHHLLSVLRVGPGTRLVLFDGSGMEYPAKVEGMRRGAIEVSLGPPVARDREPPLAIELIQGISRGERMDLVVQKATELGIAILRPAFAARGVVRLDEARARNRVNHWRRIAAGACEQCGRNRLPQIEPPRPLADCLRSAVMTTRLILDPDGGQRIADTPPSDRGLALAVGPEGGFSGEELELAQRAGFARTRLGPRVLRTETASIAGVAAALTLWGDL